MKEIDTIIINGEIATQNGLYRADIAIDRGLVVSIGQKSIMPCAKTVIDAKGLVILPGLIDPHVHMRDPGRTESEDWNTGTMAAAAGGVTTVIDMPNTIPAVTNVDILNEKIEIASKKAVVDFALYGGAGPHNIGSISKLAEAGVVGFKTYMWPYFSRSNEFESISVVDDGDLLDIFSSVAETGLPELVHAENYQIINSMIRKLKEKNTITPEYHELSHPVLSEVEAVSRCLLLAAHTNLKLYFVHVSAGSSFAPIIKARQEGHTVYAEVCAKYLFATKEHLQEIGPYGKVTPPMRTGEEQDLLWQYLENGSVDTIGTDHAPVEADTKDCGWKNIFDAPSGSPAIETMLPLFLAEVHRGNMTIGQIVSLLSTNAAKIFGLYPRKGTIQIGSDADFVLVDMDKEWILDPKASYTKQKSTNRLFASWKIRGKPVKTMVRGRTIMDNGVVDCEPGYGVFITPGEPGEH